MPYRPSLSAQDGPWVMQVRSYWKVIQTTDCPTEVVGEEDFIGVATHPAALELAKQFTCSCGDEDRPDGLLSHSINCEQVDRGENFTLDEVLTAFDAAVAATAPPPETSFLEGRASFRQPEAVR